MECKKIENSRSCPCSYEPCANKGICCECVSYHLGARQLPGCFFPANVEKTYDRSFRRFAELVMNNKI
jgi:hypothetical protein